MKGLLLRLSAVDSDAEAAVRVIAYFDELVAHRATIADLVRATASLAECVAGLQRGGEPPLRFRLDGTRAVGTEARAVASQPSGPARDGGTPAEPRPGAADLGDGHDRETGNEARVAAAEPGGLTPDGAPADPRRVATGFGNGCETPAEAQTSANGLRGEALSAPRPDATGLAGTRDHKTPAQALTPANGLRGQALSASRPDATDLAGTRDHKTPAQESERGGEAPATPRVVATELGGEAAGQVWLERDGEPGPLDDLVLERFAIAARVLGPAPQVVQPHLADPALVELVLGERAAAEDRSRALVLLGLDAGRPLRVVAVGTEDGRDPGAAAVALVARGGTALGARVAVVGEVAAVLVQPREGPATVVGVLANALFLRARERGSSRSVRVGVGMPSPGSRRGGPGCRLASPSGSPCPRRSRSWSTRTSGR
ncbi:hypothetical protein [Amycolatopsis sp. DSM 110486]|uniref:hypothetical protein n=1 Tax=Amycolatopsis sp. DSM 110486 TaxID=2865832 RepID=UPI001C6A86E0|nr:hypothetical protein [Amycolatopsis sp. DSM 110486]QYN18087.1 hypothetical protein K1T34_35800 [Amycolatopsis sp. DSM 110486]